MSINWTAKDAAEQLLRDYPGSESVPVVMRGILSGEVSQRRAVEVLDQKIKLEDERDANV